MTVRTVGLFLLCSVLILVFGCGKTKEEKEKEKAMKQAEELVQRIARAGEKMREAEKKGGRAMTASAKKVEPVDFRNLKALLPENLPGMKREEATGESSGALGGDISMARASYQADGGASIGITISDMGSVIGSPMGLAAYGWATAKIDRETDSGYEKTTTFSGYPAYEEYDKGDQSGRIHVIVANRFMVDVQGSEVKMDAIKAALGKLDLSKLAKMKKEEAKN